MLQIKIKRQKITHNLLVKSIQMELTNKNSDLYLKRLKTVPTLQNIQIYSPLKNNRQRYNTINSTPKQSDMAILKSIESKLKKKIKIREDIQRWRHIQKEEYQQIKSQLQLIKSDSPLSLSKHRAIQSSQRTQKQQVYIKKHLTIQTELQNQKAKILHSQESLLLKHLKIMSNRLSSSLSINKKDSMTNMFLNNIQRQQIRRKPISIIINLPKINKPTISNSQSIQLSNISKTKQNQLHHSPTLGHSLKYQQDPKYREVIAISNRLRCKQDSEHDGNRNIQLSPWVSNYNITNQVFFK